jgi:hypothetical protein
VTYACEDGLSGDNCEYALCHNDDILCFLEGGECSADETECVCYDGYIGDACEFKYSRNSTNCIEDGDECICKDGYLGESCEIAICYGIPGNETEACSGNGVCADKDKCLCQTGKWTGSECDIPVCNGLSALDKDVCNKQGECTEPGACECDDDSLYTGKFCDQAVCYGVYGDDACSGNGICSQPDHCVCLPGYEGDYCNITSCGDVPADSPNVCSGKGLCIAPDVCECTENYFGDDCGDTTCFGTISTHHDVCIGGVCVGFNDCECVGGFFGATCDTTTCFSKLSNDSSVCNGNGECVGLDTCECYLGYDGEQCETPLCNFLPPTDPDVCNGRGSCTASETCECQAGFSGAYCQFYSCYGQSEIDPTVCSENGQCDSIDNCTCRTGYSGQECQVIAGESCFGKSELDTARVCGGNGECTAHDTCTCASGYTGNQCQYPLCNNVASNKLNVCGGRGHCSAPNTCECRSGYSGSDCEVFSCFSKLSNDSTVCGGGNNHCIAPEVCLCKDKPGYVKDCSVTQCGGIQSDEANVCSGRGTCIRPNKCECNTNSRGQNCEIAICFGKLETDSRVCSGHGSCTGPNTCTCKTGYSGSNCAIAQCFGNSNPNTVCNGKGSCIAKDKCACVENDEQGYWDGPSCNKCTPNYRGAQCLEKFCDEVETCDSKGVCNADKTCDCRNSTTDGFYAGPFCRECQTHYYGSDCKLFCQADITCGGNGICSEDGTCSCNSDRTHGFFAGSTCSGCAVDSYGIKCRTQKPKDFRFKYDGSAIIGVFVNTIPQGEFDCSLVVHPADMNVLGDGPVCAYKTASDRESSKLTIEFGAYPELSVDDTIRLNVEYSSGKTQYITVHVAAPATLPTPTAVAITDAIVSVCDNVRLDASLSTSSDGRELKYKWSAVSGIDTDTLNKFLGSLDDTAKFVDIPSDRLSAGSYKMELTVENFFGKQATAFVEFTKVKYAVAQSRIRGSTTQETPRSKFFRLDGFATIGNCFYSNDDILYTFSQTDGLPVVPRTEDGVLLFDSRTFLPYQGVYEFNLQAQPVANLQAITSTSVSVQVTLEDLVAKINDGNRIVSNLEQVTVSAASSSDPEETEGEEYFSWDCRDVEYDGLCPEDIQDVIDQATTASIVLPAGISSGTYLLTAAYAKDSRISFASVTVSVVSTAVPIVSLTTTDKFIKSGSQKYGFKATITTRKNTVTSTQWLLDDQVVSTQLNLWLDKSLLSVGDHTLEFKANTASGLFGSASYAFTYGAPSPTPGTIDVPAGGVKMLTPVTFIASQWKGDGPLYYQWFIKIDGEEKIRTQKLLSNSIVFQGLPPGEVVVGLTVHNNEGTSSKTISKKVKVQSVDNCDEVISSTAAKITTNFGESTESNLLKTALSISSKKCVSTRKIKGSLSDVSKTIVGSLVSTFNGIDTATPLDNAFYSEFGNTINNVVQSGNIDSTTQSDAFNFIKSMIDSMSKSANTETLGPAAIAPLLNSLLKLSENPLLSGQLESILNKLIQVAAKSSAGVLNTVTSNGITLSSGIFTTSDIVQEFTLASVSSSSVQGATVFSLTSGVKQLLENEGVNSVQVEAKVYKSSFSPQKYTETDATLLATNILSLELVNTADNTEVQIANLADSDRITIRFAANIDLGNLKDLNDETSSGYYPTCRYYNDQSNTWVTDDTCTLASFNTTFVTCRCSHATLYAATYDYKAGVPINSNSAHVSNVGSSDEDDSGTSGLSKGGRIAIGVAIGIGVPVLILVAVIIIGAGIAAVVLFKKKGDDVDPLHKQHDFEMRHI